MVDNWDKKSGKDVGPCLHCCQRDSFLTFGNRAPSASTWKRSA